MLWVALVLLLVVAQSLLVALTISHESSRRQELADVLVSEVAADLRRDLLGVVQALQAMSFDDTSLARWRESSVGLLRQQRALLRVERRDTRLAVEAEVDSPWDQPLFTQMARRDLSAEAELSCALARRSSQPSFSRTFFVPKPGGLGLEVVDLCVPLRVEGREAGFLVATFALSRLLDAAIPPAQSRLFELAFVEGDGTRLARSGAHRGSGVYRAERVVDLPGSVLQLRADAVASRPSLIPNFTTALVLGLSLALFALVLLLARDVRRRARVETALAEALAFRKAMEDSLITGLRARDLVGAITYVNPAFCAMVGYSADEMRQWPTPQRPPYWPPEHADEYQRRQLARLTMGTRGRSAAESREGFETLFMRKSGERFPVMIYEAPLVDGLGQHTGWMSAVVDLSAQRRMEDLSRQQQDRLQATARLATVGEMASLMSHELNQPLSAIASYASGSLNLLEARDEHTPEMLHQALSRIAEQAERAGRVIKSVHAFVRRREQQRETIGADMLFEAVLPLVRLQARKSGTRIEIDMPARAPRVVCDRTMVEQVLLNLTRNAIQAMENDTPLAERVLTLRARQTHARWVTFGVLDAGPGITPEVAAQIFTPFFTTKPEGMGLGLSLCRTVIEQHGGALDFGPPEGPGRMPGTEFRFTLPAPRVAEAGDTAALTAA